MSRGFWKGVAIAVPIGAAMWVGIVYAILWMIGVSR